MAIFYADEWQPDFGMPFPRWYADEVQNLSDEDLRTLAEFNQKVQARLPVKLEDLPANLVRFGSKILTEFGAKEDPIQFGWTMESWAEVQQNWKKYKVHAILGGNRCLGGNTLIHDPVAGLSRKVSEIDSDFHVRAWDGEKMVTAKALRPFTKGHDDIFTLRLSNGQEFEASASHLVLGPDGWTSVGALRPGCALFLPATTGGTCREGHRPDATRYLETALGSQGDCLPCRRSRGEPPLPVEESGQGVPPLLAYVPTRTWPCGSTSRWLTRLAWRLRQHTSGGRDKTPSGSRACQESPRRATRGGLRRLADLCVGTVSRAFCRPCKSALPSLAGLASWLARRLSIAESYLQQPKPEFVPPDNQSCQFSCEVVTVATIRWERIDVKWDMEVPGLHNYEAAGVIHHNSSKSSCAASLVVHAAMTIPEAKIRCYHVNEDRSISDQQAMVWAALPQRFKNLTKKKGTNFSIQYSQKNGFVGGRLILPPMPGYKKGSEIVFTNYQAYRNDAQVAEGFSCHIIWADEELPQKLFETLLYRLVDYRGRMVLTFTTLNGWSPLVQDILGRTKTLQTIKSPILDRKVPVFQESLSRPQTAIYYFQTLHNAFIPVDDFKASMMGRPIDEVMARAHGVPTKASNSPLPRFDEMVHVIRHEDLPFLKEGRTKDGKRIPPSEVTRYQVIDPAGNKPWAMIWAAVDARGVTYIYREWPDETYGAWAEPGNDAKGKKGPAQKPLGWGIRDYVDTIHRVEEGEVIYERFIDSRLGNAQAQGRDGATSIVTELDDAGLVMIPAPGLDIAHGLSLINDKLGYDEKLPISALNTPRLFISDRCQNLISCMKSYSAEGGKDENWKDFIDVLRYLFESGADYVPAVKETDYGHTGSY